MTNRSKRNQNIDNAIIKIEILAYFLINPHVRDTIKGFSRRLFIDYKLLYKAMEELVDAGIVEKSDNNSNSIYRLKISYATLEEYLV